MIKLPDLASFKIEDRDIHIKFPQNSSRVIEYYAVPELVVGGDECTRSGMEIHIRIEKAFSSRIHIS